ncbi:MAG TPA: efflux RND transporter periplasmic adaptor subunit [Planctomycetota bacterium]
MRNLVFVFLLAAGCDHKHPEQGPPEEEKTFQVTVWDERFEIFLEHKALRPNAPTPFVTHVTDLARLEPRREGKLTFVFRTADAPAVEHVENAPKRAGIYIPEITLPKAGAWTFRLRVDDREIELPELVVHADRAPAPEAPEGISFLKERQWKLRTKIEPAGRRKLVERLRLPAVASAPPGSRASVLPPAAGRVLGAGKPMPSLGDKVEAGQTLALLQPPVSDLVVKLVEAEAGVARGKLALAQAELSHARVEKLAGSGARTTRELEESDFALRSAKAAHEAALALRGAYEKSGLTIREGLPVFELRSPIAGRVIQIGASVGEHVPEDRAVFTVLSTERVLVEARVAEADLPRVGSSRDAVFEAPDAKGRFVPLGKPLFLGPEVDVATRAVPLVYEAPNPDGALRVGMALTVHVETRRAEEALAVPESALVDEDGRPVVFVQIAGETFEKRDVRLGIRDSGYAQVLDGLRPGERVVTSGAYAVRLASVSTSLPAHGHSH